VGSATSIGFEGCGTADEGVAGITFRILSIKSDRSLSAGFSNRVGISGACCGTGLTIGDAGTADRLPKSGKNPARTVLGCGSGTAIADGFCFRPKKYHASPTASPVAMTYPVFICLVV